MKFEFSFFQKDKVGYFVDDVFMWDEWSHVKGVFRNQSNIYN